MCVQLRKIGVFDSFNQIIISCCQLLVIDIMLSVRLLFLLLQVETYKSFRPGDIVLAKVVSLTCTCGSDPLFSN